VLLPSVPLKGVEGLFSCRLQPGGEARGAGCLPGDDGSALRRSACHGHHFCRWVSRVSSHGEHLRDTLGYCTGAVLPGKQPNPRGQPYCLGQPLGCHLQEKGISVSREGSLQKTKPSVGAEVIQKPLKKQQKE